MQRLFVIFVCLGLCLVASGAPRAHAQSVHFLIPAGAGGGLDGTARAVGATLRELGLIETASFENMTGGGGARAMSHFIQSAPRLQHALIVNSTPLVVRTLQGLFPHTYHDLVPIASVIGNYGAFVVRADSPLEHWEDVVAALRDNPRALNVGGGSVRGSMDHVVLALAVAAAGIDPRGVRYVPYDAAGQANLALLGNEVHLLSTGLGEVMPFYRSGDMRILAITAPQRHDAFPELPTLIDAGYEVSFVNWRGFFGPPGLSPEHAVAHRERFEAMVASDAWRDVRTRYGWIDLYMTGDDFVRLLADQERLLAQTMRQLGFLQ
jgi:putative tricarboxylic transport membrane protein